MISTVFAAIKTHLDAVLADAGEPAIRHELGAHNLGSISAPPQIVWVIGRGPVTPARQSGSGSRALGINQIADRNERCFIHVWGADYEATERLMNHFVAAARATCTAFSFQALSTDWTIGQDQVTNAGRLCVLEIEIRIPFTAEPIAISQPPHTVTVTPTVNH